jgi:small conductance mechanosensitive channel
MMLIGVLTLLPAWIIAAVAAPLPAALQNLFNPTPGVSAQPASAAQAASAPSPASQAELTRSLNTLIGTLENEKGREALLAQLKGLRDATQAPAPVAASAQTNGALLGVIASGIASVETNLNEGRTPLHFWAARFGAAASELRALVTGGRGETLGQILLDIASTLAGWGACAALLVHLQRRVLAHYGRDVILAPDPTFVDLLSFTLREAGPWIIAFVAVLLFGRGMPEAIGRTLGLVIAYAIVVGVTFRVLCVVVISAFSTAHRRVAVRQLLAQGLLPIFAIGACGALGDAMADPDVTRIVGPNLAGIVSSFANMTAAVLSGYFALAYRRPVTHLIRNRPYSRRRDHKLATEALDILASLWHIPILLIAVASVVATIAGRSDEGNVWQPSLLSALLLVFTLFASALLPHLTRRRDSRAERRAPHLMRLLRFASSLLVLVMWLAYIRFELDVWSGPIAGLVKRSAMTPGFRHALFTVIATVFGAWFVWILVDTVILEVLGPSSSRNKALEPGVRARTMLPLVRNATFATVATLAAIIGAASLGINLTPLLAGAGVIGLAFGFGAKSLVTDLITGLFIIVEETISVGDWIDVDGGHAGIVMDLTIRTVRLRDGQGAVHTIPFSQIKIVKNLSRDFANAVFEVRVPFSADMEEVTRIIAEVGADLIEDYRFRDDILGPIEVWGLDRFDNNCVVVKGQIKTRPLQQWSIARAFNARLKLKMDAAGIEIPLPQMQLHTSSKETNLSPQTDDRADGEGRQAAGASSAVPPRADIAAPPELHVLREPPPPGKPAGQTASTSSMGSLRDGDIRK